MRPFFRYDPILSPSDPTLRSPVLPLRNSAPRLPHARLFISDTALDIFANLIIRSLGEFVKLDGNRLISAVLRRRFKSSIKVFSGLH